MTDNPLRDFAESRVASTHPVCGDNWLSPTGEPYVALCNHGIKPEGEAFVVAPTEVAAVDEWQAAFRKYSSAHSGTLYWRNYPEVVFIEVDEYTPKSGWGVYARLLISNKPRERHAKRDVDILTACIMEIDGAPPELRDEYEAWAIAALKNKRTKAQA